MKALCSAPGCDRHASAKTLCRRHYKAARRALVRKPPETVEARILRLVKVDPDSGCWVWIGSSNEHGYGILYYGGTRAYAHRAAYETWVAPIPEGLTLDHVRARGCKTTLCVNPAHLEPVTQAVNTLRGTSPWAERARKAACVRGHPFDAANTVVSRQGYRECLACIQWRSLNRRKSPCPQCGASMTPKSATCRACWLADRRGDAA